MKRLARIIALGLVMALAFPVGAEVTDEDVSRAREAVQELLAGSEALGREVQEQWARQFALEREIAGLVSSMELTRMRIGDAEVRLQEMAVEMYMGTASVASIQVIFSAATEEAYGAGVEYLRNVSGDTDAVIGQLRAFRAELERQGGRLEEATREQEVLLADLEAKAVELQAQLVAAQAVYEGLVAQQAAEEEARRRAEEARRAEEEARRQAEEEAARNATTTTAPATTATTVAVTTGGAGATTTTVPTTTTAPPTTTTSPPPSTSGGGTCPVAGAVSFSDTWGAPRSGGRTHKGVDMIAARNTPIVAIREGTILRISNGSLSGLAVWLRSTGGDLFFYAHLESYGDISTGQRVPAGHVLGYNGSSGNAPSWLPHLHFEHHPGGGGAVNPYPLVRSIC